MKYLKALRPEQWLKNIFVLLPLLFSGNLGNADAILRSLIAILSFCAISSSTYVINDFFDRNKDRLNPEKMHRPIAAGKIGGVGVIILAILLAGVIFLALFIAVNKRRGESLYLKSKAALQRATLQFYTPEILNRLSVLAT